jgi:hypothetical protein
LLWRIRTDRAGPQPELVEDLPYGSWLADLRRSTGAAERALPPMRVRVIDYTVEDGRDHPGNYRVFTTVRPPGTVATTTRQPTTAQAGQAVGPSGLLAPSLGGQVRSTPTSG